MKKYNKKIYKKNKKIKKFRKINLKKKIEKNI
jgi:hypothetical protein